jgi:hypothetical protein
MNVMQIKDQERVMNDKSLINNGNGHDNYQNLIIVEDLNQINGAHQCETSVEMDTYPDIIIIISPSLGIEKFLTLTSINKK